ncbi:hypothetical protein [Candidatus Pyrohabitans sp.]
MRSAVLLLMLLLLPGCVEKEVAMVGDAEGADASGEETPSGILQQSGDELRIGDILENPEAYEGKEVVLRGTVTPGLAFEFVDEQPYLLSDGTGDIWIVTRGTMPMQGAEVRVRGIVVVPYQIKGRHYEVAVVEIEREGGW